MNIDVFKNLISETYREISHELDLSHLKSSSPREISQITASIFREKLFVKLEDFQKLSFHEHLTHVEGCPHSHKDLQYAFMMLDGDDYAIMSAEEYSFYHELYNNYNEHLIDLPLDEVSLTKAPLRLVYGGILCKPEIFSHFDGLADFADFLTDVDYARIERNVATLCDCYDIRLYPKYRKADNFIPFAALMRIPFSVKAIDISITLTPLLSMEQDCECEPSMWEYLVNRPFVMACRAEGPLLNEDFESSIVMEELLAAYDIADVINS